MRKVCHHKKKKKKKKGYLGTTMNHSREREVLIVVGCIGSCGDGVIEQRKSGRGYHRLVAGQLFDNLRLDEQLFLTGIDVGRHGVYIFMSQKCVLVNLFSKTNLSDKQTRWVVALEMQ